MRVVGQVEQDDREEEPPSLRVDLEDDAGGGGGGGADVAVAVKHRVVFVDDKPDTVLLRHDGVGHADLRLQLLLVRGPEVRLGLSLNLSQGLKLLRSKNIILV